MSVGDVSIHRVYSCSNNQCGCQIAYKERVKDKWRKRCPFCKKHSLILDKATTNISFVKSYKDFSTFGMISDQNKKRLEQEEGVKENKTPFWRKSKKINFNVLRNPAKYIQTGSV